MMFCICRLTFCFVVPNSSALLRQPQRVLFEAHFDGISLVLGGKRQKLRRAVPDSQFLIHCSPPHPHKPGDERC